MAYIEQNQTKSNQIEGLVRLGSVIVLTEKFGFEFVRLPKIIELNRSIVFDYVRLPNVRVPTCIVMNILAQQKIL